MSVLPSLSSAVPISFQMPSLKLARFQTGDELVFELASDKTVLVHVRNRRQLSELAGILPPRRPFPGIEEEDDATKRIVAKQAALKLQHE